MSITLTIQKSNVFKEVAQTTEYTGAKMVGDDGAYERISTVDENQDVLGRFWDEARAEVAKAFVRLLSSEGESGGNYNLTLDVSPSFDNTLTSSMQLGLFSYFVQSITAKWYVFTNKQEAAAFAQRAEALLDEVRQKAFFKKKPTRPYH
ncbi:MAG: hypothetical protein J6X59_00320 [Bacteroidales bacterium]|nr:hypothetical protein [Bacteroidales bacterium]